MGHAGQAGEMGGVAALGDNLAPCRRGPGFRRSRGATERPSRAAEPRSRRRAARPKRLLDRPAGPAHQRPDRAGEIYAGTFVFAGRTLETGGELAVPC